MPGSQSQVKFWEDIWYSNYSFATLYPHLYHICKNIQVLLTEVIHSQGKCISFRRTLTEVDRQEWGSILHILSNISFTHLQDRISWRWEPTGQFSVRSLYKILNFRGEIATNSLLWWTVPIPHKIQIFMWLVCKHKILTRDVLASKGWTGSPICNFCTSHKTANHLFINCPLVKQVWFWMGKGQHYFSNWSSIEDVVNFALSLPKYDKLAFILTFSAMCWTIWKYRNELCFQNIQQKTG